MKNRILVYGLILGSGIFGLIKLRSSIKEHEESIAEMVKREKEHEQFLADRETRLDEQEKERKPQGQNRSKNQVTKPVVSLEQYIKIQTGMSHAEVAKLIGSEGVEMSRTKTEAIPGVLGAIEAVMYNWGNDDGSNIVLMFQNDKVMTKSQFGLK